jgi:C4-dicarboxylate-binding protein DctP
MDSKILIEQFDAIGASAVAINFSELYTSLQTGLVDGQENPLDTITTMKFYEVQRNLLVSEHGSMEDVFLVNPTWWSKLPPSYRDVVVTALNEVRPQVERMKEDAQTASLNLIKTTGKVNIRIADEAERQRMKKIMAPRATAAYLERSGPEGQRLLDLYRQEAKRLGI